MSSILFQYSYWFKLKLTLTNLSIDASLIFFTSLNIKTPRSFISTFLFYILSSL